MVRMKLGMNLKAKLDFFFQCSGYFGQGIGKFIAEAHITKFWMLYCILPSTSSRLEVYSGKVFSWDSKACSSVI